MTNEPTTPTFILPPGYVLRAIDPADNDLEVQAAKSGSITLFDNYDQPLPTLVQANISDDGHGIAVKSLILVPTILEQLTLKISQLFTISTYGSPMLQFFIHCSEEEIARIKLEENQTADNIYNAYQVTFTTYSTETFPEGVVMGDIAVVQTFLWDIDPKSSRGTVTTVQPAVNPQPDA